MTEIQERRRHSSTLEAGPPEQQEGGETDIIEEETPEAATSGPKDVDIEDLSGAMSALKFVPPSVRFGRGGGRARGGFSRS